MKCNSLEYKQFLFQYLEAPGNFLPNKLSHLIFLQINAYRIIKKKKKSVLPSAYVNIRTVILTVGSNFSNLSMLKDL